MAHLSSTDFGILNKAADVTPMIEARIRLRLTNAIRYLDCRAEPLDLAVFRAYRIHQYAYKFLPI